MQTGGYLSGGEKQKLLIEMLPEAEVYLLDEPMIGLDNVAITRMYSFINEIFNKGNIILITTPEHIN
ncbi:MAG: hypothetical protein ACE5GV_08975 [Candidatus Scalindua sp.]